jgi:hypothetical protein
MSFPADRNQKNHRVPSEKKTKTQVGTNVEEQPLSKKRVLNSRKAVIETLLPSPHDTKLSKQMDQKGLGENQTTIMYQHSEITQEMERSPYEVYKQPTYHDIFFNPFTNIESESSSDIEELFKELSEIYGEDNQDKFKVDESKLINDNLKLNSGKAINQEPKMPFDPDEMFAISQFLDHQDNNDNNIIEEMMITNQEDPNIIAFLTKEDEEHKTLEAASAIKNQQSYSDDAMEFISQYLAKEAASKEESRKNVPPNERLEPDSEPTQQDEDFKTPKAKNNIARFSYLAGIESLDLPNTEPYPDGWHDPNNRPVVNEDLKNRHYSLWDGTPKLMWYSFCCLMRDPDIFSQKGFRYWLILRDAFWSKYYTLTNRIEYSSKHNFDHRKNCLDKATCQSPGCFSRIVVVAVNHCTKIGELCNLIIHDLSESEKIEILRHEQYWLSNQIGKSKVRTVWHAEITNLITAEANPVFSFAKATLENLVLGSLEKSPTSSLINNKSRRTSASSHSSYGGGEEESSQKRHHHLKRNLFDDFMEAEHSATSDSEIQIIGDIDDIHIKCNKEICCQNCGQLLGFKDNFIHRKELDFTNNKDLWHGNITGVISINGFFCSMTCVKNNIMRFFLTKTNHTKWFKRRLAAHGGKNVPCSHFKCTKPGTSDVFVDTKGVFYDGMSFRALRFHSICQQTYNVCEYIACINMIERKLNSYIKLNS